MDLKAGEELLRRLEQEASKMEGLGALRQDLAKVDALMPQIRVSTQKMVEVAASAEQNTQQLSEVGHSIAVRLEATEGAVATGLSGVRRELQSQVVEIGDAVSARMATALGALQTIVRGDLDLVRQRIELEGRETQQILGAELAKAVEVQNVRLDQLAKSIRNHAITTIAAILAVTMGLLILFYVHW